MPKRQIRYTKRYFAKAKICILTSVHPAFDVRIFHKEARTLAKAGYEVILIAQHEKNETVDGVKIIALPKPRNRIFRIFGTTWRVLWIALKQKADIYHFHDPELLLTGIVLKLFKKKKVIYDVHEYYAVKILMKHWIPLYIRPYVSKAYNIVQKFASKFFDAIIVVNGDLKKAFSQHKNIAVVYNYPDLSYFRYNNENILGKTICYVGGVCKERGLETVLEAMPLVIKRHSNAKCLLVGTLGLSGIDRKYVRDLKNYLKRGNIELKGFLPHEDAINVLNSSFIAWLPLLPNKSFESAFPTKLLEYMAAGKPIVSSACGPAIHIISDSHCGILVEPVYPKNHADAIIFLLDNFEEAKEMGENGRKAVSKKYNWENESERLLEVYQTL